MMIEARTPSTRPWRGAFVFALAVMAAAVAIPAAAQVTDPVDVYHSSSNDGSQSCDPTGSGTGQSTTITFNEVPINTPANGMVIGDVTFGATDPFTSVSLGGPGIQTFVQDPSIVGLTTDTLTLTFANPTSLVISYGFALDLRSATEPPVDIGTTIELFDANGSSLGVFTASAQDTGSTFIEGFLEAETLTPIASAVISFDTTRAPAFAFDSLTYSSGAAACPPLFQGGPNERLNLWIDGGSDPGGGKESECRFGEGSGSYICGADVLLQITGPGFFTGIEPTIDTLVCNPSCADCDEAGLCALDPPTKQVRMNFRRGGASELPLGPRWVATFLVDSSGTTETTSTQVFVTGVAAAGNNLQVRRIANAVMECTTEAEPFACCTGAESGDGSWPCGPRRVVTGLPEPGQSMLLVSGLALLGLLYRVRPRR